MSRKHAQPLARTFHRVVEDKPNLVQEFETTMQRQRDLEALKAAEEKRARKAKKRLGT